MSSGGLLNILENGIHKQIFSESGYVKNMSNVITEFMNQKIVNLPISETCNMATEKTQTSNISSMEEVQREAEFMARFVVQTFGKEDNRTPPNKYCKTMLRTINELSSKHEIVFKGIFSKLKPNVDNAVQTFTVVADEVFEDGQVNWGRIVSIYAFTAHFAKFIENNDSSSDSNKIIRDTFATFVGQFVANKLGQWIIMQGGWDAFLAYFQDPSDFENKIWKFGLLTALGVGAIVTTIGNR